MHIPCIPDNLYICGIVGVSVPTTFIFVADIFELVYFGGIFRTSTHRLAPWGELGSSCLGWLPTSPGTSLQAHNIACRLTAHCQVRDVFWCNDPM